MAERFDIGTIINSSLRAERPADEPTPARKRLSRILDSDRVAIIVTNLRLQAGIPQDRITR